MLPVRGFVCILGRENARHLVTMRAHFRGSVRRTISAKRSGTVSRDCRNRQKYRISSWGRNKRNDHRGNFSAVIVDKSPVELSWRAKKKLLTRRSEANVCQAHRGAHLLSNLKPKAYSSCGRKALVGALIVSVLVKLESSLKAHIKSYRCCFYSFYDKTRITNEANKIKQVW